MKSGLRLPRGKPVSSLIAAFSGDPYTDLLDCRTRGKRTQAGRQTCLHDASLRGQVRLPGSKPLITLCPSLKAQSQTIVAPHSCDAQSQPLRALGRSKCSAKSMPTALYHLSQKQLVRSQPLSEYLLALKIPTGRLQSELL